jgi:hypothetical protein
MADFDKITAGARQVLGRGDQVLRKADQSRIWVDGTAAEPTTEPLSTTARRPTKDKTKAAVFKTLAQSLQVTTNGNSNNKLGLNTSSNSSIFHSNTRSDPYYMNTKKQSHSVSRAPRTGPAFLSGDPLDISGSSSGSDGRISTVQSEYFKLKARGIVPDWHGSLTRKRVRDYEEAARLNHRSSVGATRGGAERPEETIEHATEVVAEVLGKSGSSGKRARLSGSEDSFAPRSLGLGRSSFGRASLARLPAAAARSPPPREKDPDDEMIERSKRARAVLNDTISYFRRERRSLGDVLKSSTGSSGAEERLPL